MKKKQTVILTVILSIFTLNIWAQDWPQYLGPDRNSMSPQKEIMRTWPDSGPEVVWSVDVGIGFGGPVVKDGKVYLLDRDDYDGDIMRCFELASGKELWKYSYNAPGSVMFPGSRSVPIVDDNQVYSCGPYGDLYCFNIKTQKPVWNKNVWTDFGGEKIPMWAIVQCPLIYGELLILASQAPEAGIVAYDKLTGDVKWKTPSLGTVGYVSPAIVNIDDNEQVVMITASDRRGGSMGNVVGIEPLTGEILWKYTNWNCHIPVPSAVDAGENRILIAGGYELGATLIKVKKQTNGTYSTTELFTTEEFGDQTKTPLFYENHFYAEYGTNSRRDGMVCMSLDGEIMWKTKRNPDFNKGSMILADGLILATDGFNSLYLIEPDPSGFKQLASAELLKTKSTGEEGSSDSQGGGKIQNWAPIALADGKLLIRNQSQMLCVKVAK
ncbi:outer membrane protein assembly factor BamB family protein [Sunxiuqinia sp. A32]|uniref:outer membrane protein assembly factor BamB family protein n=1 Tax=Sunxiuqinia sp. A32 TaxID=3461496 RepID=UPI0040466B8E